MTPPQKTNGSWCNTQNEAISEMERLGDTILAKWDSYHFGSFKDQEEFVEYIEESKESDRQFFEILQADKPQLMFADLDGQGVDNHT